jgi:hypothetical protein
MTYVAAPPCGRRKTRHATDESGAYLARHCSRRRSRLMEASVLLLTLFCLVAILAIR